VNHASYITRLFGFENGEGLLTGLAGVDDDRLLDVTSESNEPPEYDALYLSGRVVVMVVEADLAYGDHARPRRQTPKVRVGFLRPSDGVMRVDSDCRERSTPAFGERDRGARGTKVAADADDDEAMDSRRFGAREGLVRPVREVLRVQVAVRVDEEGVHGATSYGHGYDARREL
jgi:hypothetical protein